MNYVEMRRKKKICAALYKSSESNITDFLQAIMLHFPTPLLHLAVEDRTERDDGKRAVEAAAPGIAW